MAKRRKFRNWGENTPQNRLKIEYRYKKTNKNAFFNTEMLKIKAQQK